MMTSSNGNIFRVTGHLCGEFTGNKGQWCGALMFSLICVWIKGWVNNREAGDLIRYRAHYDVTVMIEITRIEVSHAGKHPDRFMHLSVPWLHWTQVISPWTFKRQIQLWMESDMWRCSQPIPRCSVQCFSSFDVRSWYSIQEIVKSRGIHFLYEFILPVAYIYMYVNFRRVLSNL